MASVGGSELMWYQSQTWGKEAWVPSQLSRWFACDLHQVLFPLGASCILLSYKSRT